MALNNEQPVAIFQQKAEQGDYVGAFTAFVKERGGGVSFVYLQDMLSPYMHIKGDLALCLPEYENIILWSGMSEECNKAVAGELGTHLIEWHPTQMLVHMVDGGLGMGDWKDAHPRKPASHLLRHARISHSLDRFGCARFRRWRLYAEAGLAGRQSVLWLSGDTLVTCFEGRVGGFDVTFLVSFLLSWWQRAQQSRHRKCSGPLKCEHTLDVFHLSTL